MKWYLVGFSVRIRHVEGEVVPWGQLHPLERNLDDLLRDVIAIADAERAAPERGVVLNPVQQLLDRDHAWLRHATRTRVPGCSSLTENVTGRN